MSLVRSAVWDVNFQGSLRAARILFVLVVKQLLFFFTNLIPFVVASLATVVEAA
jgi:hypothetical protein